MVLGDWGPVDESKYISKHFMIQFSLANGIKRAAGAPTLFLAASHLVIISRTTIVKR